MLYLRIIIVTLIWSANFVAARILSQEASASQSAVIRYSLMAIGLSAYLLYRDGKLPKPDRSELMLATSIALSGPVLYNILFFAGLQTITSSRSGVINALTPAVVAVCSVAFGLEKVKFLKTIGLIVAVYGLIFAISDNNIYSLLTQKLAIGDLYTFVSVLFWVIYTMLIAFIRADTDKVHMLFWASSIGSLVLMMTSICNHMYIGTSQGYIYSILPYTLSTPAILASLYLGFLLIYCYIQFFKFITEIGVIKSSMIVNMFPVVGSIYSVLILDEKITHNFIVGTAIIVVGLILINIDGEEEKSYIK